MTTRRPRLVRALAALLSLAAGLVLAEVLVGRLDPDVDERIHYAVRSRYCCRPDADVVWRLRPDLDVDRRTDEFSEHFRTGSAGLRGGDPAPDRDRPRVLAVGDSFTFGTGVDDDETWEAILAASLAARGAPAEVLNAGVPGYGFDQVFRAAESWSATLRPDLVLFGLHCTDLASDWDVPLWDLREGRLVPLDPGRNWIALQARLREATPGPLRGLRTWRAAVAALRHRDPFGLVPELDWAGRVAWQRDKIVALLGSAPLPGEPRRAAVIMPCKEDLDGTSAALWGDLAVRLEGAGIATLDAGRGFRPPADPARVRGLFYDRDIHLAPAGHRRLASEIEGFLRARGLLETPAPRALRGPGAARGIDAP